MKRFVDTNIFIYSLFPLDKNKHRKCLSLFEQAEKGKIKLWTTDWVIAELVWFLRRRKITVLQCKEIIVKVLATKGLETKNRDRVLAVLDIWEDPLSLTDAIHLVDIKQESIRSGYSYDKDLDKTVWFTRLEP